MRLIIFRHGNTFAPGDTPVMCGARTDLDLVEKGRAQARLAGACLKRLGVVPDRAVAGPLRRTRDFMAIALNEAGLSEVPVELEERLREIDYGPWEGKSDAECEAMSGAEALARWNTLSVMPDGVGFSPTANEIEDRLQDLVAQLSFELPEQATVVLCSSNGIIRYFLKLVGPEVFDEAVRQRTHKVKTGNVCVLESAGPGWRVVGWNLSPDVVEVDMT